MCIELEVVLVSVFFGGVSLLVLVVGVEGWGGWVKTKLKLISAQTEASVWAWLSLAIILVGWGQRRAIFH